LPVPSFRALASLITALFVACALAWPLTTPFSDRAAHAQTPKATPAKAVPKVGLKGAPKVGLKAAPKATLKGGPKVMPKARPPAAPQALARTPHDVDEQAAAQVAGIPDARVWGDVDTDFARVLPTATGPWLALSGGGADGAYGAGLVAGWTQAGNRPDFTLVSGVSIGSLIAPYAFLGASYDEELRKNFLDITAADVFEDRPTPESLMDTWPLKRLIERRVGAEMLAAIAVEHKRGRRLLVATTNLDAGRRVIWNMGAIAERGDDRALKLFRDILLASSSIPGFFPPVEIEVEANGKTFTEMHLDGTVTAPFFVAPESMFGAAAAKLPTKDIYVVVNSKLTSDFDLPERKTISILARTIGVALTTGLQAELMLVTAGTRRLGINLNVASIPDTFREQARSLFDPKYMQALFSLGIERAKAGSGFERRAAGVPDLRTNGAQ
jgi:predicted acylesterase/phospholipase RssA